MAMWVFGYGSLIWNPGFEYLDSKVGYIKGYNRRFWQGNDFHRGNPDKIGRVATLVEDEQGLTWGKAFLLGPGADTSLAYLDKREAQLGGYCTTVVTFQPRDPTEEPFPVVLYTALPSNRLYAGSAPLHQVATEIAEAKGHCGHNAEYLIRLVHFMKEQLPDVWDEHLYNLDHLVRARLKEMNLSVDDVMGVEKPLAVAGLADDCPDNLEIRHDRRSPSSSPPDFASRVPSRKLRCLDI
ncbi:glutathione-specific gamma-glutamylcyclotransferase 1-like [Argiope bruennichi]|uniref:glutathione-specific gamma-glutamylcyclotransferase 1-like n=1 Tax=Argiope bruennichi TaxID=94029 RepID=UPI0024953272|nr:glutathione-specific gamma-glutamylcyclotransferase 1-like [Argiope bruennichi]